MDFDGQYMTSEENPSVATAGPGAGGVFGTSTACGATSEAREDPQLGVLSLPAAAIKRIAKSGAPRMHIGSEAVAGLHRVAQGFVLHLADRALAEAEAEANKAAKQKRSGKTSAAGGRMAVDHVMKVLTAEVAPIASKLASLFPELMPDDFKPPGVRLLEQLQEQEQEKEKAAARVAKAENLDAAMFSASSLPPAPGLRANAFFASWAAGERRPDQPKSPEFQGHDTEDLPAPPAPERASEAEAAQEGAAETAEGDGRCSTAAASTSKKRPRASAEEKVGKKRSRAKGPVEDGATDPPVAKAVPEVEPKSAPPLSLDRFGFFGRPKGVALAEAQVNPPTKAVPSPRPSPPVSMEEKVDEALPMHSLDLFSCPLVGRRRTTGPTDKAHLDTCPDKKAEQEEEEKVAGEPGGVRRESSGLAAPTDEGMAAKLFGAMSADLNDIAGLGEEIGASSLDSVESVQLA
jgi:histone H3/H4